MHTREELDQQLDQFVDNCKEAGFGTFIVIDWGPTATCCTNGKSGGLATSIAGAFRNPDTKDMLAMAADMAGVTKGEGSSNVSKVNTALLVIILIILMSFL